MDGRKLFKWNSANLPPMVRSGKGMTKRLITAIAFVLAGAVLGIICPFRSPNRVLADPSKDNGSIPSILPNGSRDLFASEAKSEDVQSVIEGVGEERTIRVDASMWLKYVGSNAFTESGDLNPAFFNLFACNTPRDGQLMELIDGICAAIVSEKVKSAVYSIDADGNVESVYIPSLAHLNAKSKFRTGLDGILGPALADAFMSHQKTSLLIHGMLANFGEEDRTIRVKRSERSPSRGKIYTGSGKDPDSASDIIYSGETEQLPAWLRHLLEVSPAH